MGHHQTHTSLIDGTLPRIIRHPHRGALAVALALVLCPGASLGAKKGRKRPGPEVECTDPSTDEKYVAVPQEVRQGPKRLRGLFNQRQIHILDLTRDPQHASVTLPQAIAEEDWCAAARSLRTLEDAIAGVDVQASFVEQKFSRVERWLRGEATRDPTSPRPQEAERLLAQAAARLSSGDHRGANQKLNATLTTLFGTKNLWDLPNPMPELLEGPSGAVGTQLDEGHIQAGCPQLAKRGQGSPSDYEQVRERLRALMNQRKLRVMDLQQGEAMLDDLSRYRNLGATWPAIRVACAMLGELQALSIDLGFAMARFHTIHKVSRDRPPPPQHETTFKELVRSASDAIATNDFATAHQSLESLLILLGAASTPGDELR